MSIAPHHQPHDAQDDAQQCVLPSVLLPPRTYRVMNDPKVFLSMTPLDIVELPRFLIPAIDRRRPPMLRCGYPIPDSFLSSICREAGFIDDAYTSKPWYPTEVGYTNEAGYAIEAGYTDKDNLLRYLLGVRAFLGKLIGYPQLGLALVYGAPAGCIFEVRNNYRLSKGASPEAVERLRIRMDEAGPPKWYLDGEYPDWDRL